MGAPHDLFAMSTRPQRPQRHEEKHRVQHDEERGEPVGGEGDAEGRAPTAECVDEDGSARRRIDELDSEDQDRGPDDQRCAPRGASRRPSQPQGEPRQPRQREQEHQTQRFIPRPSSSSSTSAAARSPSPSGGEATSGAPPPRVWTTIPASR